MRKAFFYSVWAVFPLLLAFSASGQIQINLGPDEMGENQVWNITATIQNAALKSYDNFPDIPGFRRRGTSSSSQTSIINGQMSSSQSIIQAYSPIKQGIVVVPSFKIKVNDQIINVTGKKVKVGPPVQAQPDPFRNFFDRDPMQDMMNRRPTEFVDVRDDAMLAVTTNKNEVYVGEGFTTTLSFLMGDNNEAPMQFFDLNRQLSEILKKIKPASCWEENFNIENIEGEPIEINGKSYMQYKLYQATFYPLNNKPIEFPSAGLEMIKFKVAKNPTFFGQNRQENRKTFYSKAKTVKVKDLPPHPLRESVAVGDYRLEEKLISSDLQTGQSSGYEFNVYGEGNISSISKPPVKNNDNFEFYEPNVRQNINRENGRVTGVKSFNYFMIPKEPGTYKLSDYFKWVFFNPKTKRYDTLQSDRVVNVKGASHQNQAIESNDLGPFYDQMETADNRLRSGSGTLGLQIGAIIFILLMLGGSAFLVFKK